MTQAVEHFVQQLPADEAAIARECLNRIAQQGLPADLFEQFTAQLESLKPQTHIGRTLTNIERFIEASRSPLAWLSMFEREPNALEVLVRLFSTSQYMADVLIADPEVFDWLRITDGRPTSAELLKDEILNSVAAASGLRPVMHLLREYRRREILRIAYGDFINSQPVDVVTAQISLLAEALVEAAVQAASRELESKRSRPTHADGSPVQFAVLALGKLGGQELNYSSDIDLIFIYESLRESSSKNSLRSTADEFFQKLGQLVVKLLSESIENGIAYRVDMRLRPHGRGGALVVSHQDALQYYDSFGRTWERQAFVKARPIAGDKQLGQALLEQLQPWIYRRYLMRADITGLIALKRRIEQRAKQVGDDERNVKLGHGGIRDIEYVIQFLQLLHGADQPEVRCTGTLEAIQRLQSSGCLTAEEESILENNYRYLRQIEHHLQIMFDRQTHTLPDSESELNEFATRIELSATTAEQAGAELRQQLQHRTTQNRKILDHLLKNAFADYDSEAQLEKFACPESDLLLDPEPSPETIESTLSPYGFRDASTAYRHLQDLARETIPFLSTRRSRHFLAAIAPQLLASLAKMPNPDATLVALANVSASLGGKAVLWELFSANPPSMDLCLRLCAASPYLASILTSNPGMIDELLDSLMLDRLPTHEQLAKTLDDLCRGAVDIAPMLHSFKISMHLHIGVRDILGKNTIVQTHTALSDVAEVCMEQVIEHEFHRLVKQMGMPTVVDSEGGERGAEFIVLAVGKLGGREPNYHSDLDVIFLFDGEGNTRSLVPSRRFESTTNRHFFNQLAQRIIQAVTQLGPSGKLYDLDVRLRPLGRSGQLAISLEDVQKYFEGANVQVWEKQVLCKARPIWGNPDNRQRAMTVVQEALRKHHFRPQDAEAIYNHRLQLEEGASPDNLKRGRGGTMDVEFIVQLLQLAHANSGSDLFEPGTLAAIRKLVELEILDQETAAKLSENYEFLRSVESGIRLMNLSARHELPSQPQELERLTFLLESENRLCIPACELRERCQEVREQTRSIFEAVFQTQRPVEEEHS